LLNVKLTL